MCLVSMIADDWRHHRLPNIPYIDPSNIPASNPSREEFDALKKELEELKKALLKGKEEDIANGEPDCEMEEKIEILRQLGEMMGINFDEVFKPRDDS